MPICSEWWLLYGFSFQPFSYSSCPSHHYFMLQLTLIIFFLTFTVYVLSLLYYFRKKLKDYFLSSSCHRTLLSCTWCSFFATSNKILFSFPGFFTPFQLRVQFLINCKDFFLLPWLSPWRYNCLLLFSNKFLMPSSVLCFVV